MSRITEITKLYYAYLDHLEETTQRLAPLQLTGKIEDYLTKEFVTFLFRVSEGFRFAIVNSGIKGEPKIDMAIIKGGPEEFVVESFVEAKYFRNRHRMSPKDMDAVDEHAKSLDELKKQLSFIPKNTHGFHYVSLGSKIYGLAFVSYTRPVKSDDRKEVYFEHFLTKAESHGFRYHNLEKPYLRSVYEDIPIEVLGSKWLVTLRGGLWRTQPNE